MKTKFCVLIFKNLFLSLSVTFLICSCELQRTVKRSSQSSGTDLDKSDSDGNKSGGSGATDLTGKIRIDFSGNQAPADAYIQGAYSMKYDGEYLSHTRFVHGTTAYTYQKSHITEPQKCAVDCSKEINKDACQREIQCTVGDVQFFASFCAEDKQGTCTAPVLGTGVEYPSLNVDPATLPYLGYFSINVCENRNGKNSYYLYSADVAAIVPANYSVTPYIPSRTGHEGSLDFMHFSPDLTEDNTDAQISFKLKDGYFVEIGSGSEAKKSFRATVTATNIQIFPLSPLCVPR